MQGGLFRVTSRASRLTMFMLISTNTIERRVCPPCKIGKKPRSVSAPHIVIVEGGPAEYQNKGQEKYGPREIPPRSRLS